MPSLIFCFVVFFSHFFLRFVSSFEQSNGNCMISFVCFYCLKSGKCIIISVCRFFFSKSRSFAVSLFLLRPSHSPNLPSLYLYLFLLCLVPNWTHKNGFFLFFFKVQIRLDSFFKNSESSCEKVVVVFVL